MTFMRKMIHRVWKKDEPLAGLDSFLHPHKQTKRQERREALVIVSLVAVVSAVVALGFVATVERVSPEQHLPEAEAVVREVVPRHPLTGAVLEEPMEDLPQVFGVMVENAADAWPLSGVDQAFLVIEAPVEANIPRFIVFTTQEDQVNKLGPVRSSRPYYLDWNDELDAVYGHVGGSPEALDLIANRYNTIDLDQFFYSGTYYRQHTNGRYAPHNVFTTSRLLRSALEDRGLDAPLYKSWKFMDGESRGNESLKVDFAAGSTYDVDWKYDAETNTYTRYQGFRKFTMEDGATIEVNNVVVMATDVRTIDAKGRKHLRTLGEGDALFAKDGVVELVTWKKDGRTDRLRFYDQQGREMYMNAGKTWIQVVDNITKAQSYE